MKLITNQSELDAALAAGATEMELAEGAYVEVKTGRPRIVTNKGNAVIVARESSQPHVVAWGSSQPHVEAWGSSQPHVEAKGFSHLLLSGKLTAKLDTNAWATLMRGAEARGGATRKVVVKTARDWCDYYGVKVERGFALVYKGVNDEYTSPRGTSYAPGTRPEAPDWDGGDAECGGGLHFSPTPAMTREFHSSAKRYMGCWVRLTEMAVHWEGASYPQKCKAKRVAKPCYEVDIKGKVIQNKAGK